MNTPSSSHTVSEIFTCARCGFCCQGETTVSLDTADQERMIKHLNLSRDEVIRQYWRITGNTVQMRVKDGHCISYAEGKGCIVHDGRPWRCRQWPLHPSMLDSKDNYLTITASCPGLNTEISYEDFCHIFRALLGEKMSLPSAK